MVLTSTLIFRVRARQTVRNNLVLIGNQSVVEDRIWLLLYDRSSLPVVVLLVICFFSLRRWRGWSRPWRILILFLWFTLSIEVGARVMALLINNNLPLLHLYTLGELLFMAFFYRSIFEPDSIHVRYFKWIVGGVAVLVIANSIFLQSIYSFNSYAKTLVQFLVILYSIEFAFTLSDRNEIAASNRQGLGVINFAILFYYCGSLFIFFFTVIAEKMQEHYQILFDINVFLIVIFYVLILLGLWKAPYKPLKSPT